MVNPEIINQVLKHPKSAIIVLLVFVLGMVSSYILLSKITKNSNFIDYYVDCEINLYKLEELEKRIVILEERIKDDRITKR